MKVKSIDIVITTYNRPQRLAQTITNLSQQTNMDFNLIINDDGGKERIDPSISPIITKYIYNTDDGYHRVGRFNESVSLCVSPKIILLDDDCIPHHKEFVESYLNELEKFDVCRGIVQFPDGARAGAWFSTANLGMRKSVIDEIGLFDMGFDGHYGHEDRDLGNRIGEGNYTVTQNNEFTRADHGSEMYADGDRTDAIVGHNTRYFIQKWGYDPRSR